MWQKTVMAVALAAACAGCMSAEDRRAADEAKCRSYGFTKKNDAFQFIGDAAFTGAAGQLRYETVDLAGTAGDYTKILGDVNGDKVADFEIILLGNSATLHSTDFIL